MAAMCSTGQWTVADLASIRQAKGISLQQISSTTKIGVPYLEAIERLEFERLPGGVFSTSYIRQYAQAIEYDEWELLSCFDTVTRPQEPESGEPPASKGGWMTAFLRWFAPARR